MSSDVMNRGVLSMGTAALGWTRGSRVELAKQVTLPRWMAGLRLTRHGEADDLEDRGGVRIAHISVGAQVVVDALGAAASDLRMLPRLRVSMAQGALVQVTLVRVWDAVSWPEGADAEHVEVRILTEVIG